MKRSVMSSKAKELKSKAKQRIGKVMRCDGNA